MRKDFLFWGARLERWLLRVLVLCAVMLVAVQWFAYDPVVRTIGKVNDQYSAGSGFNSEDLDHLVTFQMLDYTTLPMATVLVNGEKKGNFEHRYVTVSVSHGDVLEIDTKYYKHPVSFKVVETFGDVVWPVKGRVYKVEGTTKRLGTVKINGSSAGKH